MFNPAQVLAIALAAAAASPAKLDDEAAPSTPEPPGSSSRENLPDPHAVVHADGSVVLSGFCSTDASTTRPEEATVRLNFGLPRTPPTLRRRDEQPPHACSTAWEEDGIRYSQTVFFSRLPTPTAPSTFSVPPPHVLLVMIAGESTANEYTNAQAAFAAEIAGQPLPLELRAGYVHRLGSTNAEPLALLDVPATGVANPTGAVLRFQAQMPPGTSGSMTVKIPLRPVADDASLLRLLDLDVADELRRLQRLAAHHTNPPLDLPPIRLDQPPP
jgi:hypothetical protein